MRANGHPTEFTTLSPKAISNQRFQTKFIEDPSLNRAHGTLLQVGPLSSPLLPAFIARVARSYSGSAELCGISPGVFRAW
jgi:hypothetical protein